MSLKLQAAKIVQTFNSRRSVDGRSFGMAPAGKEIFVVSQDTTLVPVQTQIEPVSGTKQAVELIPFFPQRIVDCCP